MAGEQDAANKLRSLRWEKLFAEAKDHTAFTRKLEAMKRVMEENHEVLARLAKS